jgi:predicted ATPase
MQRQFGNSSFLHALDGPDGWSSSEQLLAAFEAAWRQGPAPEIADYVRGEETHRLALLIELVHTDLEYRLKSGAEISAADYLNAWPEIAADAAAAAELQATEADLRKRLANPRQHSTTSVGRLNATPTTRPLAWPQVAGYEIVAELGQGGMGVVYKAIDQGLGRHVALKFLPDEYARDNQRLARFRHEARTASALNHPHICTVHALGEHAGRPFIVLEYVDGTTLHSLLVRRPEIEDAIRWILQAARALAAAHAAGVVHRDVKPENLMVRDDGYLKVVDFGLARGIPKSLQPEPGSGRETDPGSILGTVLYMSPEQAQGLPAESASDVFALGVVFYQLLTGVHPFAADSPVMTLAEIAARQPAPPSRLNPAVPATLDRLIEGMLHKDPRLRLSAAEIDAALTSLRRRSAAVESQANTRPVLRRDEELAVLHTALAQAKAGRGCVVCVAGEPGIGKTTLVDEFLAEAAASADAPLIARGQCSELIGETEVYLPVLGALESLLRADQTQRIGRLLQVVAPTWRSQIGPAADGANPDLAARAMSQLAMLREFDKLLEEATRPQPLILFLDDIHWADLSTSDLLAHLGRQCAGLRLLVVLSYRPTEMLLNRRRLHQLLLELQARGVCRELTLALLEQRDVQLYLELAFGAHGFPAEFASEIYARTEGSPLFMVDLLGYLVGRGVVAQLDGRWHLVQPLPDLRQDLPASVRSMIGRKLDRLSARQRQILTAASVQGTTFDSATVAGALTADLLEIEDELQQLDRVHRLVRMVEEQEFPDNTLTARYAFVHSLYQQALYHDLSPGRRTSLSLSLAKRLEQHHGQRISQAAAQLAYLYETGRDLLRAAHYIYFAAQNAGRVFAHHDAIALARRGLRMLASLPDSPERDSIELTLQTLLGLQLQVTLGYGAPDAKHAYSRALGLCPQAAQTRLRFPVLWGLWLCYKVASNLPRAQVLANELYELARQQQDAALMLQAHQALGMTAFCRGELGVSLHNVEQAVTLYDPLVHGENASSFGQDPSVMSRAFGSVVLWLLGFPDSARQQSRQTVRFSAGMSPTTQAVAWHFAAMLSQLLREPAQVRIQADRSTAIACEHGLSFWQAGGEILIGWATARNGASAEGIARLQAGLQKWRAIGSATYETYYLGLLAELLIADGQLESAAQVLDEALLMVQRTDERFYLAELYRLRAETEFRASGHTDSAFFIRANDYLGQSIAAAEKHGAKALELRALTSRLRWRPDQEAKAALSATLLSLSEGRDVIDWREATEMLETIS